MEKTVASQRKFFNTNNTKNISFRIEQLKKFKRVLKENEHLLDEAIYSDFKKSSFENFTAELSLVYHDIDEAIKKLPRWAKRKRIKTNLINFPARSYIVPEPLGNSLIIGAWNFPYLTSLAPVVATMAAGNTIILKPSELSSNSSKAIHKMISENFDQNYFAVVEGGIPETTLLLEQKFDKIFFTGSVEVGKIIYKAASRHLTPITLELGGKSPAFVTEKCDLKISAKRLIWAKYLNSGQACTAPDYVLVHKSVKEKFLELAKKEIERSDYSFDHGNYVQIVNEHHTQRLINLLTDKNIYCGGSYNLSEKYIEPTIIENVTFEDTLMKEEIFGPILPVIEYDKLDDIIKKVKSRPKPLACYIYTHDKSTKNKILEEISFGSGAINDSNMHITNTHIPFGGVGESGIGSYHGEFGFNAFTHYKGILDKPTWFDPSLRYSPYNPKKLKWIKRILRQK
jgi:aldehyde dehydrogenase (NAD+)